MIIDFDLEEYKKGNCEVFTKSGRKVEILKYDLPYDFPIVTIKYNDDDYDLNTYTAEGRFYKNKDDTDLDLVLSIKEPAPTTYVIVISYMDDEVRRKMVLPSFYSKKLKKYVLLQDRDKDVVKEGMGILDKCYQELCTIIGVDKETVYDMDIIELPYDQEAI